MDDRMRAKIKIAISQGNMALKTLKSIEEDAIETKNDSAIWGLYHLGIVLAYLQESLDAEIRT